VYDQGVNHFIQYHNQLVKLSPNLEIEWEQTFETNLKSSGNAISDLIELPDNQGFIAVGNAIQQVEFLVNPILAQINKASVAGDSLWTRYYQWGNAVGNDQSHSFLDIDLALDGGFVCVGNSIDDTVEGEPTQQAWIIKVDEQGCLVPDCHLVDTTSIGPEPFINLSLDIFPNPTSDYINIHYQNPQHTTNSHIQIINTLGQIVYRGQPALSEVTLIVPCHAWERGIYFVQYWEDGQVSKVQQVVVD